MHEGCCDDQLWDYRMLQNAAKSDAIPLSSVIAQPKPAGFIGNLPFAFLLYLKMPD